MTEDDLISINDFDKYERFIRNFILENITLWKLIFYPYSSPLSDMRAEDPQDPYTIFTRELGSDGKVIDSHGVVLFDDKDDTIQNSANVTVLVNFTSVRLGNSPLIDTNYINFQIISKGSSIRKLSNGVDRTKAIGELIVNEFDKAKISNIGQVHKMSFDKLSINEENVGHSICFKALGMSGHFKDNKNVQKRGSILC